MTLNEASGWGIMRQIAGSTGRIRGSVTQDMRYASTEFTTATEVAKQLSNSDWIKSLRDPRWSRKLVNSAVVVGRLPVVRLVMCPSEADVWFSENYPPAGRRICGSRFAQSVLELVKDQSEYLAGKSKQRLRANVRHAREAGVQCYTTGYGEFDVAVRTILTGRKDDDAHEMRPPQRGQQVSYYLASNRSGHPLVFAAIARFGNFGVYS